MYYIVRNKMYGAHTSCIIISWRGLYPDYSMRTVYKVTKKSVSWCHLYIKFSFSDMKCTLRQLLCTLRQLLCTLRQLLCTLRQLLWDKKPVRCMRMYCGQHNLEIEICYCHNRFWENNRILFLIFHSFTVSLHSESCISKQL